MLFLIAMCCCLNLFPIIKWYWLLLIFFIMMIVKTDVLLHEGLNFESRWASNVFCLVDFRTSVLLTHSVPWRNVTEASDNLSFYMTVYGSLAGANSVFTLVRAFLFAYSGIAAAKTIHQQLLGSIMKVTIDHNQLLWVRQCGWLNCQGAVHSVHHAIFWSILTPSSVTHLGNPPKYVTLWN